MAKLFLKRKRKKKKPRIARSLLAIAAHFRNSAGPMRNKKKHKRKYLCREKEENYDETS